METQDITTKSPVSGSKPAFQVTKEYLNDEGNAYYITIKDTLNDYKEGEYFLQVDAKWDGCFYIHRRFNDPASDKCEDSIHICSLKELRELLDFVEAEANKRQFEGYDG